MFKYRKALKYLNRGVYLISAVMMIAGLFLTVTTKPVSADPSPRITICHYNSSGNYTSNTVSTNGVDSSDDWNSQHGQHVNDIWPSFTATDGTIIPAHGDQTILQNGCKALSTATNTPVNTVVNTPVNTATNTATATNTPVDTATNTPTNTATSTPVNTATNTPTNTATATFTDTPTNTATATFTNTPTDTNTPTNTPNTLYVTLQDPYCVAIPGTLMQWAVVNNNAGPFTVLSWSIDGIVQPAGFIAPVGVSLLTQTALGTHTIVLNWEQEGFTSLEFTIESCALPDTATPTPTNTTVPVVNTPVPDTATPVPTLPIPETGGAGGPIIPVTGADLTQSVNGWFFGGFGMFGFGLVLSGLRKMYDL